MAQVAAAAGVPLAAVTDLDDAELYAYADAVRAQQQAARWGYTEELLAEALTLLHAIHTSLERGVTVVQVKRQRRGGKPLRIPRPEWVTGSAPDEVVVTSFRDLRPYLN